MESWRNAYRSLINEQYLASLSVEDREAMWREVVEKHLAHVLVAHEAGKVIGFAAFGSSRDEDAPADQAEIHAIYVAPESWSTGAGRVLWLDVFRRIQADGYKYVSLWVITGNERAIRFYEKAGFVAEPDSRKSFELGGTALEEIRYTRHTC